MAWHRGVDGKDGGIEGGAFSRQVPEMVFSCALLFGVWIVLIVLEYDVMTRAVSALHA